MYLLATLAYLFFGLFVGASVARYLVNDKSGLFEGENDPAVWGVAFAGALFWPLVLFVGIGMALVKAVYRREKAKG